MNNNEKKLNRLGGETSPYLLQHAGNPVDWHPWDDEAFEKARAEDKPVFLSIGYSTCHWCHVMERESFENAEVAALMNRAFVSIKVDREERPDVDGLYMEFCQALTGSGGWPLTIVMTPDRKPFFAATYIPRESGRRGMGMLELVPRLGELWRNDRERLMESAERITAAVRNHSGKFEHSGGPDPGEAFEALTGRFDAKHGGFGGAPKFPTAHLLIFLTRYWRATGDGRAKDMAVKTLKAMRLGGIYDHLGFGFHRYSTDAEWRLPHFEKMLYDQALLSLAYLEARQAFDISCFGETAREIFTYVIRDLASPSGAFYSAEDADSEGEEGRFYVWRHQEILQILGKEEGDAFCRAYGVKPAGNFRDESSAGMAGDNVLLLGDDTHPDEHVASRRILLEARGKRPRPHRDEKILTDWNGLMIAALARGARVLNDPSLAETASSAADFILSGMRTPDGKLLHCLKGALPPVPAMADDYAFFTWGLLELYEATFKASYLREALTLTDRFITSFLDDTTGAFFSTPVHEGDDLLFRRRELYDSAMPSANSVTMMNLLRLARMTGRGDYEDAARRIGEAYPRELSRHPAACSNLLSGILMAGEEPLRIVLSGPAGDMGSEPVEETLESGIKGSEPVKKEHGRAFPGPFMGSEPVKRLIAAANGVYLPHAVILLAGAPGSGEDLEGLLPGSEPHVAAPGQARAQVCAGVSCRNPVTKPEELEELLAGL